MGKNQKGAIELNQWKLTFVRRRFGFAGAKLLLRKRFARCRLTPTDLGLRQVVGRDGTCGDVEVGVT